MFFDSIKAGNQYRAEKYGAPETLAESYQKAQEYNREYNREYRKQNSFTKMSISEKDEFKSKFEFWDEWSGSRWVRRRNPVEDMLDKMNAMERTGHMVSHGIKERATKGAICRSNPVTGNWEAI